MRTCSQYTPPACAEWRPNVGTKVYNSWNEMLKTFVLSPGRRIGCFLAAVRGQNSCGIERRSGKIRGSDNSYAWCQPEVDTARPASRRACHSLSRCRQVRRTRLQVCRPAFQSRKQEARD